MKKTYLPIKKKTVEPKLFCMVFRFTENENSPRIHQQRIAYDLEEAISRVHVQVAGKWIQPTLKNLVFHSVLTMQDIKTQLKNLR
jgi:hypothetical protein